MYVSLHILIMNILGYILFLLIEHYAKKAYEGEVKHGSMHS
jgi:hypothetical protein